ncbi:signal peptidase [Neisseria dentiae]|uniref:signal peptidase n=1 Tax=Neisseria dentiae TaxID=194197 RepID=UPI00359F5C50
MKNNVSDGLSLSPRPSPNLRPLQNRHLRRISALCAARSLAYPLDMSALAVLLRLELHPHLGVLQRSQPRDFL